MGHLPAIPSLDVLVAVDRLLSEGLAERTPSGGLAPTGLELGAGIN
jgi:hypothetical protein